MSPHRKLLLHRPSPPCHPNLPPTLPLAGSTLHCDSSSSSLENLETSTLPPPLPTLLDYFPVINSETTLIPPTSEAMNPTPLSPSFPPLPRPRITCSLYSEKQSMNSGKQSTPIEPSSMPSTTASLPSLISANVPSNAHPAIARKSVFQRLQPSPVSLHPPISATPFQRPSYASTLQTPPLPSTSAANHHSSLTPMPDFCPIPPEISGSLETPQILFHASDVHKAQSLFNLALVARFTGRRPPVDVFERHVNQDWGLTHPAVVGLLNPKHILIRFFTQDDLAIAWEQSGFLAPHFHFLLFKWNAHYATKAGPQYRAQWVQFPHLPLHFQTPSLLKILGNTIGKFLKVDPRTAVGKHPISPRILVEVDTARPCPKQLHLGWTENGSHTGFDQPIVWETQSNFCLQCKRYGHTSKTCSRSKYVSAPPPLPTVPITSPPLRQVTASTISKTVSPNPPEPAAGRTLPSPKNLKTGTHPAQKAQSPAPPNSETNWVQSRPKPLSSDATTIQKSRPILTTSVTHRDSFSSLPPSSPPPPVTNTLAEPSSVFSPPTSRHLSQRPTPPAPHLHIGRSPPHTPLIIQPSTSHNHPSTSSNPHQITLASPSNQPLDFNPFSLLATLNSHPNPTQPTSIPTQPTSESLQLVPTAMAPTTSPPLLNGPITEDSDSDFEMENEDLPILSNDSPPLSPSKSPDFLVTSNNLDAATDPFNLLPLIIATPISPPSPRPVLPHPTPPNSPLAHNSSPALSHPSTQSSPSPLPPTVAGLGPCLLSHQHMQLSPSPSQCTTTSTHTWTTSPPACSLPACISSSPASASPPPNFSQNQQACPSAIFQHSHEHSPHSASPTSTSAQPHTLNSSPPHAASPTSTSVPPHSIPPSTSLVDSAKSKPSRKNKKTPKSLPPPPVPPYRSTRSSKHNKTPFH